jgi:hypothetical protein
MVLPQATTYFRMVDTNFTGTMDKKEFARVLKERARVHTMLQHFATQRN